MQQAYNTTNPSYMNTNFYNTSSYGSYPSLTSRSNPLTSTSCKGTGTSSGTSSYLGYGSPGSPFGGTAAQTAPLAPQYATPYAGYSCAAAGSSSGFAQGFGAQVITKITFI